MRAGNSVTIDRYDLAMPADFISGNARNPL